jgi:hypothetical protein
MQQVKILIAFCALAALSACGDPKPTTKGVYMLMDTSGTYTKELKQAQKIINVILARLNPGDSFAVARIDTGSFSEKDIVAKVTFDERPSVTNREKRNFRDRIDKFVKKIKPASYTDITGGILQASEYLNEKKPGRKVILIYSDLAEDLKKGYVRDISLPLDGFEVVALNVTKLGSDNVDPRKYLGRLDNWEKRVQSGGGHWKVINDMDRLEKSILQ